MSFGEQERKARIEALLGYARKHGINQWSEGAFDQLFAVAQYQWYSRPETLKDYVRTVLQILKTEGKTK